MSLFGRNKRARGEGDEAAATEPGPDAADAPTVEQTAVAEPAPGQRDPAQLDALVGEAPSSRRRGRLRRRLRHLRRVREVLLRDLGGLAFELHRSGTSDGGPVLEGKLARLSAVDRELRDLEAHLDDRRGMIVREPGIGGTCAECGEIFGSEARFCWACGNQVAVGDRSAPHLAAWSTHPQLTGGNQWAETPTATLPQADAEPGGWSGEHIQTAEVVEPGQAREAAAEAEAAVEAAPAEEPWRASEQEPSPDAPGHAVADAAPAAEHPDPPEHPGPPEHAPAADPAAPVPTNPVPEATPEAPAPNEPATGDVGGDDGAEWSDEPAGAPTDWLPRQQDDRAPEVSSGDPLASPPKQAGQ